MQKKIKYAVMHEKHPEEKKEKGGNRCTSREFELYEFNARVTSPLRGKLKERTDGEIETIRGQNFGRSEREKMRSGSLISLSW